MSEDTPKKITPIPILLDEPVGHDEDARAELGFEEYADVLTGVILGSDSPFTVGIFGDWGTGKTTLMRCIERKLNSPEQWDIEDPKPTIIPVWFEAWRYEREEDLIAPLLGEIADAVEQYRGTLGKMRQEISALTESLAASLSLKATLPFIEVGVEGGSFTEKYEEVREALPCSSDYRKAYRTLKSTLKGFARDSAPENKIVVFVDDLDRCLPEPAVEVLEATKVFLGFEGMVFVLGLKREIIETCIRRRYCRTDDGQNELPYDDELGSKYVDKLVQVPFSVPAGGPDQMADFVEWLAERDDFPKELAGDYEPMVPSEEWEHGKLYAAFDEAHHRAMEGASRYALIIEHLNPVPRTVKRAVNAYSVAARIAMGSLDDDFDPDVMVTLVVLQFLAPEVYREFTSQPGPARSRLFARAAMALGLEHDLPRQFTDTSNHGPFPIRDSVEEGEITSAAETEDSPRTVLRRRWGAPIGVSAARLLLHTRLLEADADIVRRHARVATAAVSSSGNRPTELTMPVHLLLDPPTAIHFLSDESLAQSTADALRRLGPRSLPCLSEVLAYGTDLAAMWAAELMGELGGKDEVPALIDALGHPEPLVRAHAASALGEIGPAAAAALPALRELIKLDPSLDVRDAAESAIAAIESSPPPSL